MKKHYRYISATIALLCIGVIGYALQRNSPDGPPANGPFNSMGRAAKISPDYSGVSIPANIAPLNFSVKEPGISYCVKIRSLQGPEIELHSRSGNIYIPENSWRKLLEANRGQEVYFDIYVKSLNSPDSARSGRNPWNRFESVAVKIALEDIDGYLVYRRIEPVHSTWRKMGVYQRDLQGFDESIVVDNGYFGNGCVNCHAFCNNRTEKMLLGIRSPRYGSSALLVNDEAVSKIGTKFGYTSWHPSGRLAAYSINHVTQFFHTARDEVRDVVDLDSLLAYYVIETAEVKTTPALARKQRLETYPAWSPDGRHLYFCSAAKDWTDVDSIPKNYDKIKYDLMRISYDVENDRWGDLETVLSAADTGLSILLPRVSPDGRWLVFCMCDYGCFPVYRASSDLYMIDLKEAEQSGRYEYRRLDINSDKSESWHSFSSNSRWIAFSSKRGSDPFTRSYLAYIDDKGRVHKPFVLPQKDPTHYDSCLWTYSAAELIAEPVRLIKEKLGRVVRGSAKIPADLPVTGATPKARIEQKEPWYGERE